MIRRGLAVGERGLSPLPQTAPRLPSLRSNSVSKVKGLVEAVRGIPDGAHIALGGFAIARNTIALVHELIRQQKKDLTLSQCVMGMDTDLLVGAGVVRRLITGGGSLDRFGPVRCVNRARDNREIEWLDSTSLSISFAYLAGALGISFIPIKSMFASEMLERLEKEAPDYLRRGNCPFTGEEYVLLRALQPDVAVVHVQAADEDGNSQIAGARWENEEQAKSAVRTIVVTEQLVPREHIQRTPERTHIPGHHVEAVVHLPFGAHPTAVYGCYDYDSRHLQLYAEHAKSRDSMRKYLDEYVFGAENHEQYLGKIGGAAQMEALRADPALGY